MLVPAILYKEDIQTLYKAYYYSKDMTYFSGWFGTYEIDIPNDVDGYSFHYAIIDNNNNLIGYFTYKIDWYSSQAYKFGLFTFKRNNSLVGLDVRREISKIINQYHIHRIEWCMIGGNPVERHYDKFCQRYNGKKFIYTDAFRDKNGNYHNNVAYEIIFNEEDNI